jgi:tetratricopeptide (TPR) repeat protein/V8-like Glu-specific endopeptidase
MQNFLKPSSVWIGLFSAAALWVQPQHAIALSASEVGQIAKTVTVRITDGQGAGSGVIIQQTNDIHTVLTAAHVLTDNAKYTIQTADGQSYAAVGVTSRLPGVDLALIQFRSSKAFPNIQMGNSTQALEGNINYVAGFPARSQAITDAIYNFTEGKLTANASRPLADGYALVYTNSTLPGMSGGPVFNGDGQLIGIHGRADTTEQVQNADLAPNIYIKTGFNLGVPINLFLRLASQTTIGKTLTLAAAPAPTVPQPTADDFFLQGRQKFEQRDDKGAIAAYTEAIRLRPTYAAAYVERGFAHLWLGDTQPALADVNRATDLDPQNGAAYLAKGGVNLLLLKNNQQALVNYEKAKALASAQGDPAIARKAQGVIAVLQSSTSGPFSELAIALYRTQIFFGAQNTQQAAAELQQIDQMLCAANNEKMYMVGKFKTRIMMLPVKQRLPIKATTCEVAQQKAAALLPTLNQGIQADGQPQFQRQYAHYLRGLVRAEIVGDRPGAIADLTAALKIPWPTEKAEEYKEAQRYLTSL